MRTTTHKAVAALIGGACTALGTAMLDGKLDWPELVAGAGFALVSAGAVWRIPNRRILPNGTTAGLATSAIFETPRDS